MATPTLEEKCTQLQLMSAPAFLAAWAERHPADRGLVREVLGGGDPTTATYVGNAKAGRFLVE